MIFGKGYGRPGDELTWSWLNNLLKMCRTNTIILGPNCGLAMIKSEGTGTALRVTNKGSGRQLAVTDGTISARVTTTAGSGNVFLVTNDGTTLTVGTVDTPVLNFGSTTGGIADGTYVWIEQGPDNNWWITSVDCGN
jgi:hypothetical protein